MTLALASLAAPVAAVADSLPAAAAENSDLWFVELSSAPTADGTSLTTTKAEKAAFRSEAKKAGLKYSERYAFDTLWNGLSIKLNGSSAAVLSHLASVKAVYPVARLSLPPTGQVAEPDLLTAKAMTGADIAQNELGLSGAGVKVAVMDTGIDYDNPDLGGCFGPSCRVFTGYDFVGDAFTGSGSPMVPDSDPDDCGGHGTHVAGIVGANGVVRGVAPAVRFGAYRVFGCAGSTTADIMIAAMERVLADKMQVLNMSIGSSFQWPQYPTATAANRLVNKGVVVVASIGNSGASGLYAAGAPGVGDKVIGVASFDNTHEAWPYFTVGDDDHKIVYSEATGAPAAPTSGSAPMARTGTPASTADACSPLAADSLAGEVALIRRGGCAFYAKAHNAQDAGAVAVVIYNNAPGPTFANVTGVPAVTIPVVGISDGDGVLIDGRLAEAPVTMTWTDDVESIPTGTGNRISWFSSYGLSPDLALKPDLGAPGGFIYSTLPLERGGHGSLNGTSMASPHVAGAAALLLQAKPGTNAGSVRSIFQNSAEPKAWWGNPALGLHDNVHRQGAGMLDIPGAIGATTQIEPAKLSLGESQGGPATRTLTIRNQSATAKTYDLSHAPALATGTNTFTVSFLSAPAAVGFSSAGVPTASLTVPAGGAATVDVTITAPASLADRSLYGGYAVLRNAAAAGEVHRIPYAGFKGDYQSIQALAPGPYGFPWLARLDGGGLSRVPPASATYSMVGALGIPYVIVHLDHQVRRLRAEVLDTTTGKSWHRAFDYEYLGRNSASDGYFSLSWAGVTTSGKRTYTVPDGQYVLKLTAVKALGIEPADVETWTSPAFTIDRP